MTDTEWWRARWLSVRLEDRQLEADRRLERRMARGFERLRRALAAALRSGSASQQQLTTGFLVSRSVDRLTGTLEHKLREMNGTGPAWLPAHRARIAAKRLRYLIELFAAGLPDGPAVVARLAELQAALGSLQDARVVASELETALASRAGTEADRVATALLAGQFSGAWHSLTLDPGLVALVLRLAVEMAAILEHLRPVWGPAGVSRLGSELRAVSRQCLEAAAVR
jgi:CHAD domain-containing protein